jgi:DNA uptake protein ComE-like DNA-binding protein
MFSREHRSGIFLLLLIIIAFQIFWYFFDFNSKVERKSSKEEVQWLTMQNEIDSLKQVNSDKKYEIKPFNPNFITDYKGSVLGMSVEEIDRLHKFREQNKYVNSAKEFQQLTKVSNELLNKISPHFKFPDWVTNKNNSNYKNYTGGNPNFKKYPEKKAIVAKDINSATKEEIMEVYGIGEKISEIILQEKNKFGAFASIEQLQYVWGVSPEAYQDIQKRFFIGLNPSIIKIDVNNLSIKELSKFPYFDYNLARQIVIYRSANDDIKNIEDLTKIKGMPNEKIRIIALYLEF